MEIDPSLLTGVEKIDEQHKELINRIDLVRQAGKNGTSAKEIIPTLMFIQKYVSKHFADEEELQLSCGYPKYNEHKAAHISFSKKVETLFDKCNDEGVNLITILETNKILYNWLVTHIHKVDMEFAQYYKENKCGRIRL